MNEMQRDVDDRLARVVRREIQADGHIKVRADCIRGDVEIGQTVYVYVSDGSVPFVVTGIEDGVITAELVPPA